VLDLSDDAAALADRECSADLDPDHDASAPGKQPRGQIQDHFPRARFADQHLHLKGGLDINPQ
jgi:hypothetical protein